MKKLIFLSLLILIGFLTFAITQKIIQKNITENDRKQLPHFELKNLQNKIISPENFTSNKPLVIIFFNSDCDLCDNEAQQITENWEAFEQANILFIGENTLEEMTDFAERNELNNKENVFVLQDSERKLFDHFQIKIIPSNFIFNENQRLIKYFEGETKIAAILKYLHQNDNQEIK